MTLEPRVRRTLELALRIAAFALLAWALWTALHRREGHGGAVIRVSDAARRLPALTRDPRLASLHVEVDSAPRATSLAWLAALRRAGVAVGWSGDVPALGASLEPVADPAGGVRLAVAAPSRARIAVTDDAGAVDVLSVGRRGAGGAGRAGGAGGAGASIVLPFVSGAVRAADGAFVATPARADSLALRAVLVVGAAGWEAKFAAAALEERGWRVATRMTVAPGATVVQGVAPLDTARFSAVVLLDTTSAALADEVASFVRQGGGLVLAGTAARTPGLAPLAPGRVGGRVAARAMLVSDSVGPSTLGVYPVVDAKPAAVAVARRGSLVTAAAMRVGAGRVVQVGIDESWRWRMEGPEGAVAAHRAWWSSLVAAVAYAPTVHGASHGDAVDPSRARLDDASHGDAVDPLRARLDGDELDSPRARLVDALGDPRAPAPAPSTDAVLSPWLLTAGLLLLLLEWASRRLRGAP